MKFNLPEIKEIAMAPGDQEGRLMYKCPSKSLYDSPYKEKWFKLKGNFMFYYRLNVEGVVEKNEPSGVFILENVRLDKENEASVYPFGFSLTWKDDPFKKHCFYSKIESTFDLWISKLTKASYEVLRSELLVLRLKIYQKTGKDPLEQFGINLPVYSIRGILASPSKASSALIRSPSSNQVKDQRLASNNNLGISSSSRQLVHSAPSSPNLSANHIPKPPMRPNRDKKKQVNKVQNSNDGIGPENVSFKSHLSKSTWDAPTNADKEYEFTSSSSSSSSFKSYI